MYHSITFTNASEDDLNTGGFTETSTGLLLNGVNTWDEWHLIPSSRPTIAMPGVSEKYIEIPGRDGSIDLSDWLAGRPIYGDRQGSLEFYHQNGYEDWETVRRAMAHYFHGRTLKMILEDDPAYYYEGRFKLNEWKSEASHSKVVIDYHLKPYKWHIRPQIAESQPFDGFGLERDYDNYFYIHEFQYNTYYLRDQFVKYENKVYICDPGNDGQGHPLPGYTSGRSFDKTKWSRIFRFEEAKEYTAWQYVVHEGKVYISNRAHAANVAWNPAHWNLVYQSFFYWRPIPEFYVAQNWYAGQYVKYDNRIYCLKRDWKAGTALSLASEYWDLIIGIYEDKKKYYKGDYVFYKRPGESKYKCYQFQVDYPNPTIDVPWDDSYWTKIEDYDSSKGYYGFTPDIDQDPYEFGAVDVIYDNKIYMFKRPYRYYPWSEDKWAQIRNYSSAEAYKTNDYVMYNNEVYRFTHDYSEKDGVEWSSDYWVKIVPYYTSGNKYYSGDYVVWEGNIYRFMHTYQYGAIDPETQEPYVWNDSYWTKVEEYSSYNAYFFGQIVLYNGNYYRFLSTWYGHDYWSDTFWEQKANLLTSYSSTNRYRGEYSAQIQYAKHDYVKWNGEIYRFNRDWTDPEYWDPSWWIETPAISGEIDLKGLAGVRVKASYNNPIGEENTNTRGALSVVYTGSTPIGNTASIEGYRRMDEMNDSFRVCTINTPTHIEIRGGQL